MAKLIFKGPGLQRIAAWNASHDKFTGGWGKPEGESGIIFVKDEGIYVMSNAVDGDVLVPNGRARHTVYADGFDPHGQNPDWYERARAAVGGDDFGETVALSAEQLDFMSRKTCVMTIDMEKTSFTISMAA